MEPLSLVVPVLMGSFGLHSPEPQRAHPSSCTSVLVLICDQIPALRWPPAPQDQVRTCSETGRHAHARACPRQLQFVCDLQEMKTRTGGHQQETETETGPLASCIIHSARSASP